MCVFDHNKLYSEFKLNLLHSELSFEDHRVIRTFFLLTYLITYLRSFHITIRLKFFQWRQSECYWKSIEIFITTTFIKLNFVILKCNIAVLSLMFDWCVYWRRQSASDKQWNITWKFQILKRNIVRNSKEIYDLDQIWLFWKSLNFFLFNSLRYSFDHCFAM